MLHQLCRICRERHPLGPCPSKGQPKLDLEPAAAPSQKRQKPKKAAAAPRPRDPTKPPAAVNSVNTATVSSVNSPPPIAVNSPVNNPVRDFAKAILHGDQNHRAWLLEAAEAFINGEPVPPPKLPSPSNPADNADRREYMKVYMRDRRKGLRRKQPVNSTP